MRDSEEVRSPSTSPRSGLSCTKKCVRIRASCDAGYGDIGRVLSDGPAVERRSKSEQCNEDSTDETGWRTGEVVPPVITNVLELYGNSELGSNNGDGVWRRGDRLI